MIAADKRSVTYLENIHVLAWMEREAAMRETTVSVLLREATSAYYVQHKNPEPSAGLFALRSAAKASGRTTTVQQITSGALSPEAAQDRNAPIRGPVRILNLWPAIRRHARARSIR
ncbi:MAG: hypothetical protein PHE83_17660 [Opitutaceae bacterium]|nr:hypothetical protein [Opitutaceae bacterium]